MTTLEEVRAIIELRREEATAWRGRRDEVYTHTPGHDPYASALERVWQRFGLHGVAASLTY